MSQQSVFHLGRFDSRVQTPSGVSVYWYSDGRQDVSRVRNLSLGGLFVETSTSRRLGSTVQLEFLVQEGQIKADAVVRRVEPGLGMGLKFMAVNDEDLPLLAALINRLRHSSGIYRTSQAPLHIFRRRRTSMIISDRLRALREEKKLS